MTAMAVDVPQLELYHDLAHQLTAWVEESKKICRQAEEDAIKVTPALFREFAEVVDVLASLESRENERWTWH